jgi:sec-independent protein translocase protein TatA
MGSLSIWHWLVVIVVVLLLFGRGKISELMGDMAQGIKAFKKGMSEDEAKAEPQKPDTVKTIDHQPAAATTAPATPAPGLANRAETEKRVEGSTL